jgi:CheY-like chemotaxis protein
MDNNKSKSSELSFLNSVSHQIRTPLNSIIGFSNALLAMERTEKEKEFIDAIKVSGEMILQLLDEKLGEANAAENEPPNKDVKQLSRLHFNEIQKLNILLAEDDILNVKLIEHLFAEYGMHTDVAYNGKSAIEKFLEKEYDLILMDIEMPEMNGYETTRYIREKLQSKVPVIAITAHAMPGEREKCLTCGMNDYISKPIDASLLFEIIYKTISITDMHIELMHEPITDLGYLKETMNGKKEAIKEILDYFSTHLPLYLAELNQAIENKDHLNISKMAHKIKSAAGIMGVKKLKSLLSEMETAGKQFAEMTVINIMHHELTQTCKIILSEIEAEKKNF